MKKLKTTAWAVVTTDNKTCWTNSRLEVHGKKREAIGVCKAWAERHTGYSFKVIKVKISEVKKK